MMDEAAKVRNDNETRKHIGLVRDLMGVCLRELSARQQDHDRSKLEEPERSIFAEWVPKLAATTYGTPEYVKMLSDIAPALDHHYKHNRHHPEYWSDGVRGMNLVDLLEMVCDWCAAAQRHDDGNVLTSIAFNQHRFGYSDEMRRVFENTVLQLLAK